MSDDTQSSAAGEASPAAFVKQPINRKSFVVVAACAFVVLIGLSVPIVMIVDLNFAVGKVAALTLWIGVMGIVAVAVALAAGVSFELRMPRSWIERVINVAAIIPFWGFAVILVMSVADQRLPNLYYGGLGGLAICLSTFYILLYVWSLQLAPGKIKLLRAQATIRAATINAFPSRRLRDLFGYGIPLALLTVALAGPAIYWNVGCAPYSVDGR
jgi:hypothetical protein